jgi:hypothetical protein
MREFVLIKNNGIGSINQKQYNNCCLFIALSILWKYLRPKDYYLHKELFEEHFEREVSGEEMVFSILKVKYSDLVVKPGEEQIDTLIEKFSKYSKIKITMLLHGTDIKFDLFEEKTEPEGLIIQYQNHFEACLPKNLLSEI